MPEFCYKGLNETPPGGFEYTQPETGVKFTHYAADAFFKAILAHRIGNQIPVDADWKEQILSDMCASRMPLWKGFCKRCDTPRGVKPLSLDAARSFLGFLGAWALAGGGYVSPEEAERRAQICAGCEFNKVLVAKCGSCANAVMNTVLKLKGDRSTSQDDNLNTCQICSCSNKVSVHMPLEVQRKAYSESTNEMLRECSWCWKNDL